MLKSFEGTVSDVSQAVSRLKAELDLRDSNLTTSDCFEAMSVAFGLRDWSQFSSLLKRWELNRNQSFCHSSSDKYSIMSENVPIIIFLATQSGAARFVQFELGDIFYKAFHEALAVAQKSADGEGRVTFKDACWIARGVPNKEYETYVVVNRSGALRVEREVSGQVEFSESSISTTLTNLVSASVEAEYRGVSFVEITEGESNA